MIKALFKAILGLLVVLIGETATLHAKPTYTVTFEDPDNSFSAFYPQITSHILAAGANWNTFLGGLPVSIEILVRFDPSPSNRGGGRSLSSSFLGTQGTYNIFQASVASELRTGIDPNGLDPDAEIILGTTYLVNELWFDPNPMIRSDPVPVNLTDAVSVFIHEMGHVLGFNGWLDSQSDLPPADYLSSYDRHISFDGTNLFFNGPAAKAIYGGPVPITYGNYAHVGNNPPRPGAELIPDMMNGIVYLRGTRYYISLLDVAILEDTGVIMGTITDTSPPVVSIVSPAQGAMVFGNLEISGAATDNVFVAGVQFKIDGVNQGPEDTASPYSILWNTSAVADGSHVLTATARDISGNLVISAEVLVTVNNTSVPVISALFSTPGNSGTATITWKTDIAADSLVEFGTTTSYGQTTALDSSFTTSHSVNLSGLTANTTYHFRVKSKRPSTGSEASADSTLTTFFIPNLGGMSRTTDGLGTLLSGYGRIQPGGGSTTPSGVAIFAYRQGGILVSEAGVPDSPLISSGRAYAEVSGGIVNTGLALINPNTLAVRVNFDLRDTNGNIVKSGFKDYAAGEHSASFLDEAPFLSGPSFQGTISFTSTLPVSLIALRGFHNERTPSEFLMSTLPVIDLSRGPLNGTQVIPHFAAGGGFTTQISLMNPTGLPQTGTIEFRDGGGALKVVRVHGVPSSSSGYSLAPNGAAKVVITAVSEDLTSGSVRIIPTSGSAAPTPLVLFSYKPAGTTVSEATVPVTMGSALRMYVELSPSSLINSGIAIANADGVSGVVTLSVTTLDGSSVASRNLIVEASGQVSGFLDELIPALAGQSLQGVLRITTSLNISVVGLRSHYNERSPQPDFLMATTSPTVETALPSSAERFFPQIANGDSFTTQVILFSGTSGQTAFGDLSFYRLHGLPLSLDIQ